MRRPRTWELHQLDAGDYSEGNTNTMHLTLGVPTHKSPSVGGVVRKSLQVLFKEYPSLQKDQLWLTYKKRKEKKYILEHALAFIEGKQISK